ncbi:YbgA family protein [Nonomuraea aridisoli]|uniref:YbgA family protein n=1 Tax=Nonomuraea aridisoli TaxID=2070368 RepID=UPI001F1A8CEC|nr:YbgA family protein [Nonomuraea aridisoli]
MTAHHGTSGRPRLAVRAGLLDEGGDLIDALSPYVDWVSGAAADGCLREEDVRDPAAREAFLERVFAHARLRTLLEGDWRPRDLVAFHARHKMQLLAHDPRLYREAGRMVAAAGTRPRGEVAAEYAAVFRRALAAPVTVGRNVNVLQHCLGMLGLDPERRAEVLRAIDAYQAGRVPLSEAAALLHRHAADESGGYVRDQTYFAPFPDGLRGDLSPADGDVRHGTLSPGRQ